MSTTTPTTTNTKPHRGVPQHHAAQALYEHLIELLCAVARGDVQAIQGIERFGPSLRFEQGHLHFTLPDLFAFVAARCAHEQSAQHVDYLSFRRLIYRQPTNALLQRRGCMVEVAQPHAEHARSVYRLMPDRSAE